MKLILQHVSCVSQYRRKPTVGEEEECGSITYPLQSTWSRKKSQQLEFGLDNVIMDSSSYSGYFR